MELTNRLGWLKPVIHGKKLLNGQCITQLQWNEECCQSYDQYISEWHRNTSTAQNCF